MMKITEVVKWVVGERRRHTSEKYRQIDVQADIQNTVALKPKLSSQ